jgi:hypothetical protein
MKSLHILSLIIVVAALFAVGCTNKLTTTPGDEKGDYVMLQGNASASRPDNDEMQYEGAMVRMYDQANDFTYRWIMPNGMPHAWFSYIKTTPEMTPQTYYFYAGQQYKSGEVQVWKDNEDLKVQILMMDNWQLEEAQLNVKLTGYSGPIAFGRFPYKMNFDPALEDDYTFSIPWDMSWNDMELNIAFHGEVKRVMGPMPTARVQVIHNSADAAASVVDVWLNDTLLLDNFAFRTASPFVDAPAGVEFTIAIQGPDSTSPENPIWSQTYTLEADHKYILIANGIVSPTGYDPMPAFDIYVYDMAREQATMPGNTDVLVFHGSTDAPTVDVYETGVGAGQIIDNLMYTDFAGYLELATADYVLEIRDETGVTTVAAYQAPLSTLGLNGAALTVVASGFLNPANNSSGPAFGLWVALPAGGNLVELPIYNP